MFADDNEDSTPALNKVDAEEEAEAVAEAIRLSRYVVCSLLTSLSSRPLLLPNIADIQA